jgi:hypothetical protein
MRTHHCTESKSNPTPLDNLTSRSPGLVSGQTACLKAPTARTILAQGEALGSVRKNDPERCKRGLYTFAKTAIV